MVDSLAAWQHFTSDIGGALAASGEILTWLEDMMEINVRSALRAAHSHELQRQPSSYERRGGPSECLLSLPQSLEDALEHLELDEPDDDENNLSPGGSMREGLWGILNFDAP